jgi:hypothetical protein
MMGGIPLMVAIPVEISLLFRIIVDKPILPRNESLPIILICFLIGVLSRLSLLLGALGYRISYFLIKMELPSLVCWITS